MKFRKSDFLSSPDSSIHVDFDFTDLTGERYANTPVKAVPDCHVDGVLHFDGQNRVVSNLHYNGVMIVEDSITGEDLEYDFEADSEKEYSFNPLEDADEADVIVVSRDMIDLTDEAVEAIVYEAPMSITRLAREDYPSGKGWTLVSDQDAPEEAEKEDPRWAKLKEFNFEE